MIRAAKLAGGKHGKKERLPFKIRSACFHFPFPHFCAVLSNKNQAPILLVRVRRRNEISQDEIVSESFWTRIETKTTIETNG